MRCSPHAMGFIQSNPHLTLLPHLSQLPTFPPDISPPPFPPRYLTSLPHLSHLATYLLSPTFSTLPPDLLSPHLSQLATSPLSPTFPTLPPHLSPLPFPPCHFTSLPTLPPHLSLDLSHLTTLLSFPNCQLTIIPPFPLCQLTTLPPFQHSQLTSLPPSQLVTLALWDLTVAISITTNKISHSLIEAQPFLCNTNLRSHIPHTSNSPTPHIFSIPSVLTSFR